ncbi:MAG: RNB domain-containing ribonuclease, partial [Deltaproteobacteria bacterium]|nr:RNB domain-containing ribonuclease [Deltaproteobacteria bacterium]
MSPKKSKRKRPGGEKKVLLVFRQAARPLPLSELKKLLSLQPHQDAWVADTVAGLVQRGELVHLEGGRYGLTEEMNLVAGEVSVHPDGYGFVTPDGGGKDIFINAANLKEAWHGDRVVVRLEGRRGRHREGKVIRIIERRLTHVVGLLSRAEDTFYLAPEDERLLFNLIIPDDKLLGAEPGQVVQARVTHYPTDHLNPKGEVVEVLGAAEDAEVQTLLVIAKYGLPHRFPLHALADAEKVPASLDESTLAGREDLRRVTFVTIDGEDARDFDDAVCLVKKPGGFVTLYVAIADVSHYVPPNGALDREAYERATSVYFPHRAVHMLPERLSTGICSLKPEEDRLAVVAALDYDRRGHLRRSRFTRAVIRSRARLTYRLVHRLLAEADRDLRRQYRPLLKMLGWMTDLTVLLRERRGERGSLLMSIPEAEVVLDERGWPVDVRRVDHL